jgi:hypothetical protein
MEPKIFWVRQDGQGSRRETVLSNKTLILMGDWCRKADTEKPKETPAKVGMLLTQPSSL